MHADDQTRPYPSSCNLLTMRMVDSYFLAFCRHIHNERTHDQQPAMLKTRRTTFHTRDSALFLDF